MTTLPDLFPDIIVMGHTIGKFYGALFDELVTHLSEDRAAAQAFLLTKTLIEMLVASQRGQPLTEENPWAEVLTRFQPKGSGS